MAERNISKETYELVKVFTDINNALLRTQVLIREKDVTGKAKDWLRTRIINRLTAIVNDVKFFYGNNPEDLKIMMDQVLNDEASLQLQNMTNMILALPKGIRDEVETYIEHRHQVYGKKEQAG